MLLVDSTHVSKTSSDVNRFVFEVLPRLATGVHIHIHDVHYPFEYPEGWVEHGWAWNETFLRRSLSWPFSIARTPSSSSGFAPQNGQHRPEPRSARMSSRSLHRDDGAGGGSRADRPFYK